MRGFNRRPRLLLLTIVLAYLGVGSFCAAFAESSNPRVALVIGASTYPDAKLATTENDASLMAAVLRSAGFDVTGAADPDQSRLRELLRDFLRKARAAGPDMQAFVYFAGRAIQYDGQNYLVPIDARIDRATDAELEAVRLEDVTRALADTPGLARIIVVDGARPNPYAKDGRPIAGGLAVTAPAAGSLIAFNAAPGAVGEASSGAYDAYAKALADQLREGGVPIEEVFERTRLAVNQATSGAVAPWSASRIAEPYYVLARDAGAETSERQIPALSTPLKQFSPGEAYDVALLRDTLPGYEEFLRDFGASPQAERVRAMLAGRREALIWRRVCELASPQAYWSYLKLYPKGPHAGDAERALEDLGASTSPPGDFQLVNFGDLGVPNDAEVSFAQGSSYYFGGGLGPAPAAAVSVALPEDNFDWRNIPAPQTTFNEALPALPFVVPLLPHTRRFHHPRPTGDGRESEAAPEAPPRPSFAPGARAGVPTVGIPAHAFPRPALRAPSALSPWRPTLRRAPTLMTPVRPLYASPRVGLPTVRPVPLVPLPRLSGPAFRAAPTLPHFAAPRPLAPAGRL